MLYREWMPVVGAAGGALLVASWAAVVDVRSWRIPNRLTYGGLLSALVFHASMQGASGASASLCGAALGGCLLLLPFLFGGIGAGDVKLLAALGAWLGAPGVLLVGLVTIGGMGLYAGWNLPTSGWPKVGGARRSLDQRVDDARRDRAARGHVVAVAPAMLAGVLVVNVILGIEVYGGWRLQRIPPVRDTSVDDRPARDRATPHASGVVQRPQGGVAW